MKSEKKAKWIWYKNDFEIYTFHKLSKRRYERNNLIYPCWAMDRPEYQVLFYSEYDIPEDTYNLPDEDDDIMEPTDFSDEDITEENYRTTFQIDDDTDEESGDLGEYVTED